MRMTKNKLMCRVLSLSLAVLSIGSAFCFTSCGNADTPAADTKAVTTTGASGEDTVIAEESTGKTFEKKNYGGEKFVVWQRDYDAASYKCLYIENFTEDVSDLMSQAVLKRNSMLEEYYNIDLEVRNGLTSADYANQLSAGSVDADLIINCKNSLLSQVIKGYYMPFDDLDIDYSTDWWHQPDLEDLQIAGNHYLLSNDISIYRFSGARFFYWNKRIQTERKLESPYDLMKENKWDIEHFLQMVESVQTDNGFTSLGEYGLLLETGAGNGVFAHCAAGCGIKLSKYNDEGEIEVTLGENVEKIDTLLSQMKKVFSNMYCSMDFSMARALDFQGEGAGASNDFNWGRKLFANGHFLFTQTNIACSYQFTDMVDEYGVAPNPKYNSDQENYIHKDDSNSLIWAIPNVATIDTDRLAHVIDYWAYLSSQTVVPDYYEITIKTKRAYEVEAGQVIDIVKATTRSELTEVLTIGVGTVLNTAYTTGSVASAWAASKESVEKKLEDYNNWEPY